jgi:phosphoglycolate phosphatase-like HAD superfamily hydrolase
LYIKNVSTVPPLGGKQPLPEGDNVILRNTHRYKGFTLILLLGFFLGGCASQPATETHDPLASWNDGPSKQGIVEFVRDVTDADSAHYVEPSERIAVFDNDGTLWAEKPIYFQFFFILDRIRAMAPDHPEWKTTQPFQAVLENDFETLGSTNRDDIAHMMGVAVSGTTTEEFEDAVNNWLATALHPVTGQPYTSMVYQPMLELLDYLEANGFTNFIVSTGGIGFMRPLSEAVYGIPPDRVVGTSMELEYELLDGKPVIQRKLQLHFLNEKADKPVSIERFIGRRPILAAGNSDGDYQMLEWTTAGEGKRLGLIVHHTDAKREWAYDRDSSNGRLDHGLDNAAANGWLLIDMANEWKLVFPADK